MDAVKARKLAEADETHAAAVAAAEAAYASAVAAADATRESAYKALAAVPLKNSAKIPAMLRTFSPAPFTPPPRSPSSAAPLQNCLYPTSKSIMEEDQDSTPRNMKNQAGLLRPTPHTLQPMPKLEVIRHGLNGSVQERDIYKTKQHALQRNVKYVWPQRPPPAGKMGPNATEKRWRVDIAHDTLDFLKARDWPSWQPNRVNVRYDPPRDFVLPAPVQTYETEMLVSNEDSLGTALRILIENPTPQCVMPLADIPAVLNMAHWSAAGGGFLHGARAQEEDLCRRTDLYMALRSAEYPLPEFGCNYTFPVSILRDSKHTCYQWMQSSACHPSYFPQVGIVSAAAYKDPKVGDDWKKKMRAKIDGMFTGALASGHRIIILSAWGCGAFNNPPDEIARLFRLALFTKFKGRFKQVIFALGTRQSDANLGDIATAFLKEFNTKIYRPSKGLEVNTDPSVYTSLTTDEPAASPREIFSLQHVSPRMHPVMTPLRAAMYFKREKA